jgi:DNA-directed RNA polymerase II subunit RPB2
MTHNESKSMSKSTEASDKSLDKSLDKSTEGYKMTDCWKVIESYFQNKHLLQLVKHQIESYNDFIQNQIKRTVEMFNPINIKSPHDYIKEFRKYRLEIVIEFENLCVYRPEIHENNGATKLMFPNNARLRNFTYTSNFTLDLNIKYIIRTGEQLENEEIKNVKLSKIQFGKIPIMLKSSICILNQYNYISPEVMEECKMDPGGYFIINGSEKTCIGQEKPADNIIFCYKQKPGHKWLWTSEIRSVPDWKCISPKQIYMMISSKLISCGNEILVQIPRLKRQIPLFILFRALGLKSDKEICNIICLDIDSSENFEIMNYLKASILQTSDCITYEDCLKYVINSVIYTPLNLDKDEGQKKKREFALDVLTNDLFPNCMTETEKIYLLGYMTNRIIKCALGHIPSDDRDCYNNKRIELTGTLMNNLFRNYFNKVVKDIQKRVIREINNGSWKSTEDYTSIITLTNIYKIVKSSTIENGLKRALSTGDFGIKHLNSNKVGVAQVLNRLTYASTLSHLRRINMPIDKSGKLIEPRKLHGSSWGFLCPAETPEGQSIGVVKNLSYMTIISGYSDSAPIYEYLKSKITLLNKDIKSCELFNKVKVFVNGRWVGVTETPIELFNDLKLKKSKGIINIYTSIVLNYKTKEIFISNEYGRLLRPLFKVRDNNILITKDMIKKIELGELVWDDLLVSLKIEESVIEYVDPFEQSASMIAIKPINIQKGFHYTHCEIHPSTIFGVIASCIPFPEHNQSPRNTYQSAMGKQAMGVYVSNINSRMDKTAYVLNYTMRPLVETRIMNMLKLNRLPSGNQVIVAIMTHSGYNQEDSILFNKGSIDRGLFHATIYHTEKDEDKKTNGEEELHIKPNKMNTKNMKFGNYEKINKNGVIDENEIIEDKDIIIAKVVAIKENKNDNTKVIKYEDQSRSYRTDEECYVDKNYIDRNGEGYNFTKVRIRTLRKPNIGDKFSSRHGQKGTIGNIINEEDMPFTKEGLRPDLIINPHAIPSRMTIAQIKETVLGKLLLELGLFGDGTSFGELNLETIFKELKKYNYESKGNELLYDGKTGQQIETSIFIGPVYYQRLKHMVNDKQHSRCIGPMVNLTRQPAEGRSRDGGLRFGEMERDCMISHGASRFTKERMYDVSDKYSVHVCKKCGLIAIYNDKKHIHLCKICENKTEFSYVEIPFSCKLLFQELISMNIVPRIMT